MEDKDDSVRSLLEDAWKESTADETPAETSTEPVEATESAPKTPETDEKPVEASTDTEESGESKEDDKPLDPPNRWTKAQKKWFAGLDRNFQSQLIEHDKGIQADYTRKTQDMALARQRYGTLEAALEPRREQFQRLGWDDGQAVENVMKYWDFASADPLSFIQYFAQERGIDLAHYFAPSPEEIAQYVQSQGQGMVDEYGDPVQAPQQDPAVIQQLQHLAQQNHMLQQQVQQHNAYVQQHSQGEEERFRSGIHSEIERFANETDESGRVKHEFFDEVRADMSRLLRADMAEDLHDAYEKAISLRPDVRERIDETRSIARAAVDERRRVEEAERARKASLSLSGDSAVSARGSSSEDGSLSVRDIIQAEWQRQMTGSRV